MTIQSNFRKAMENEQQIRALKEYVDAHLGRKLFFLTDTNSDLEAGAYEAMTVAVGGAESSFGPTTITASAQELEQWATESGEPGVVLIPSGVHEVHMHAKVDATAGQHKIHLYFNLYKYALDTTETFLGVSEESDELTTTQSSIRMHVALDDTILLTTDRLIIKILANETGAGGDPAVTLYMEGTNSSHYAVPVNLGIFASTTAINQHLMIGSANAAYIPCVYMGSVENESVDVWGPLFVEGVNTYLSFQLPLPCNRGGLKLYITEVNLRVSDGDATNYITSMQLLALGAATVGGTARLTDATDVGDGGAENKDYTVINQDFSAYKTATVLLEGISDGIWDLDIEYVTCKCYYDV